MSRITLIPDTEHWSEQLQRTALEVAVRAEMAERRREARQRLLLTVFAILDWLERLWRHRPPSVPPNLVEKAVLETSPTGLLISSDTMPNLEPIYGQTNRELRAHLERTWGKDAVARVGTFPPVPLPQPTGGRHRPENQQADTVVLRTAQGWCRYGDPTIAGIIIRPGTMFP